jgi:hypothetical protein
MRMSTNLHNFMNALSYPARKRFLRLRKPGKQISFVSTGTFVPIHPDLIPGGAYLWWTGNDPGNALQTLAQFVATGRIPKAASSFVFLLHHQVGSGLHNYRFRMSDGPFSGTCNVSENGPSPYLKFGVISP